MGRLLLVGPLAECTGNKSTLLRIATFYDDCLLKSLNDFKDADDLDKFIKSNQISCVISLHAYKSSRLLISGCSVPYAVIFGGTDVNVFSKNYIHRQLMTETLMGAKAVISFSKSIENLANGIWPDIIPQKSLVIPQGVNCSLPTNDSVLEKYGFNSECRVFTLIAGLRIEKDPLFLLPTFQGWQDASGNKSILLVIGAKVDKGFSDMFLDEVAKYSSVKYLGQLPQPEVFLILKDSFALVNSSQNEGMSNVILEGMHLGVPVLARANEGNKALIRDRVNGLLYHSPEEFVTKATFLINNDDIRDKLVVNAKAYVTQHHNPETEREKYINLAKYLKG